MVSPREPSRAARRPAGYDKTPARCRQVQRPRRRVCRKIMDWRPAISATS